MDIRKINGGLIGGTGLYLSRVVLALISQIFSRLVES